LCLFKNHYENVRDLATITWGLESSINNKTNDAYIAKKLASVVGVPHNYYCTNLSIESVEKLIDRFLICSEGRIDHLSGYMDGLEIWRRLAEDEKIYGIIRGDEGFGWIPVSSELTVRFSVGTGLLL
jgi:hypothetical protein